MEKPVKNQIVKAFLKKEKKFNDAVDRGIKWLDEKYGRSIWVKDVNISKLDMSCGDPDYSNFKGYRCVLSQVLKKSYGNFSEKRGFSGDYDDYPLLTTIWYKKLSKMRGIKI